MIDTEINLYRRDLVVAVLGTFAIYEVFKWTVLRPIDKLADELEATLDEEDKKKLDEQMEETDFIPFPLTTQLVQPGPYFRSDPEYIEYQKISKDKELIKQIIADAAPWAAQQIPQHGYAFQALKPKPYRSWIDAKFQDLPPPYYTQSGLEIGDDFIAWSTMGIEADVAKRIERVVYPLPAAKAMWNFVRVAFTLGDANEKAGQILTEHMKLPTGYKVTFDQLAAATPTGQEAVKKQREAARRKAAEVAVRISEEQNKTIETKLKTSGDSSSSQQSSDASSNASSSQTMNNEQTSEKQKPNTLTEWARKKKEGDWSQEDEEALKQYFLTLPSIQSVLQIAKRFKYATAVSAVTFQKEAKPMVCPPPRGAVKVSGLMQMLVPNGWMMFDVELHWDPKAKQFDEQSFKADLVKMHVNPTGRKAPVNGFEPETGVPSH